MWHARTTRHFALVELPRFQRRENVGRCRRGRHVHCNFNLAVEPRRKTDPRGREAEAGTSSVTENDPAVLEMFRHLEEHDYEGARALAQRILTRRPANMPAARCLEECDAALQEFRAFVLSSRQRIPMLIPHGGPMHRPLDRVVRDVLQLVDGVSTVDDILGAAGLPTPVVENALFVLLRSEMIALR